MSNPRDGKGLSDLKTLYIIGAVIAGIVILVNIGPNVGTGSSERQQAQAYVSYALLFLAWGGLIWAGAHIAFKKGRELVEGAVLGAFGPLGFLIEVLLPPIRKE